MKPKYRTAVLSIDGSADVEIAPSYGDGDYEVHSARIGSIEVAVDLYDDGTAKVRLAGYPPSLASSETTCEGSAATVTVKVVPPPAPATKRAARRRR